MWSPDESGPRLDPLTDDAKKTLHNFSPHFSLAVGLSGASAARALPSPGKHNEGED